MALDDWFRNTTWSAEIAAQFEQRLRRTRDKSQRLRIQASCLAATHPEVALGLLDRYFALGEDFDLAQALVERGRALAALGDLNGAAAAYLAALDREQAFPGVKTSAYLDFPCLVAEAGIETLYDRALEVLDRHRDRPAFPVERYRVHGAWALLLHRMGHGQQARDHAVLAMAAARETQSGFRYHQGLGLVGEAGDSFSKRVAALAG